MTATGLFVPLPIATDSTAAADTEWMESEPDANGMRERPFAVLHCALFSETLLESELFGHARGAFSGAHAAKAGLLETADGGTLLVRDLSEMSHASQAALLRFLELGEFRRVGETTARRTRSGIGPVVSETSSP